MSGQTVFSLLFAQFFHFESSRHMNLSKAKSKLLYLNTQSVPRCKNFHLRYKNQSVYDISDIGHCLFSDKYKTYKYSVGRTYNC
jgi:hypothetical protein